MFKHQGAFLVDTDSITLQHGSIANFLKSEKIQRVVFDSLRKNALLYFKTIAKLNELSQD